MNKNNSPSTSVSPQTPRKQGRMQLTGADGQTIRVSLPRKVIKKETEERGVTVFEFVDRYLIDIVPDIGGFHGTFKQIDWTTDCFHLLRRDYG